MTDAGLSSELKSGLAVVQQGHDQWKARAPGNLSHMDAAKKTKVLYYHAKKGWREWERENRASS